MSVPNTLKVLSDVQALSLSAVALVKDGKLSFLDLPQFLSLFQELVTISKDLPAALPELHSLDSEDAGALTIASYNLVKAVLSALGSPLVSAAPVVPAE